jgi:Cytochrome P460
MRGIVSALAAVGALAGAVATMAPASGQADGEPAPIFGIKIPPGNRDWSMISVAHVGGNLNDLRVKLGNDVAIKAYREGKPPFPDGTIIARLAWRQVTSEENNRDLRLTLERTGLSPEQTSKLLAESFVAGPATNVQFMVKGSRRYASTGGWGFAQFTDGKPDGEAVHNTCFSCHAPAKDRDFVFTRYAH